MNAGSFGNHGLRHCTLAKGRGHLGTQAIATWMCVTRPLRSHTARAISLLGPSPLLLSSLFRLKENADLFTSLPLSERARLSMEAKWMVRGQEAESSTGHNLL